MDRSAWRWADEGEGEPSGLAGFVLGLGIGIGAMYLLDPDRGAQRRAWIRDRAVRWQNQVVGAAGATGRDVAHRTRGLLARTRYALERGLPVPDATLVERVRSEMGRKVSHPRAIVVEASEGRVTLTGSILATEVDALLCCVERVRGVRELDNQLVAHSSAEGIPQLQGGFEPLHAPWWLRAWPPAERLAVGLAGAGLIASGFPRRSLGGSVLGFAGCVLVARAVTNAPVTASGRSARRGRAYGANGGRANGRDGNGRREGVGGGEASA